MNAVFLLDEHQVRGSSYVSVLRRTLKERPLQQPQQLASSFAWNCRRMRNMILVTGPGTPASFIAGEEEGNSGDEVDFDYNEPGYNSSDDDDSDDDEEVEETETSQENEPTEDVASYNDIDDDDDDDSEDFRSFLRSGFNSIRGPMSAAATARTIHNMRRQSRSHSQASSEDDHSHLRRRKTFPSMQHDGCINTACWLQTPWRFSSESTRQSLQTCTSCECPTQVLTSGDDRVVKVWDVSGAMGMDQVVEGGWCTFSPYCNSIPSADKWKNSLLKHVHAHERHPFGTVVQVASAATGHQGNVFHVTPLRHHPGKTLTCGADGCLRLCDLIAESSSLIMNLRDGDENEDVFAFFATRTMALSQTMLSPSTGLLCSDKGLYVFDVRLAPANQRRTALLSNLVDKGGIHNGMNKFCKSVAVWNPHASTHKEEMLEMDSYYVFAGGGSALVGLWDMRMDGSSGGHAVEYYKPDNLDPHASIAVSGLDVSQDGQELLVSYEGDQIYNFPIGHSIDNANGKLISITDFDEQQQAVKVKPSKPSKEIISFGGHFNHLTFLKSAKYAGPNDEYIATGSDSGHAWVFERRTGSVVSLLAADKSACNGVVPHPTLPFFITYGIDSTAKLWKATPPIDPNTDDSPSGRASRAAIQPYVESLVVKSWDGVQKNMWHMPALMPDYFVSKDEMHLSSSRSKPTVNKLIVGSDEAPRYGNALESLSSVLTHNQYALFDSETDSPIKSPTYNFCRCVSISQLRQQADRLGVRFDSQKRWFLYRILSNPGVHSADLVPDYPSNWIRHDWMMNRIERQKLLDCDMKHDIEFIKECTLTPPWLVRKALSWESLSSNALYWEENSRTLLYETAILLKQAGNEAIKDGLNDTAARRYDKAVQYCSIALLHTWEAKSGLDHLSARPYRSVNCENDRSGWKFHTWRDMDFNLWSPLLNVLVTCRLNLALLFLKSNFYRPHRATGHARMAAQLLEPFTRHPGKIIRLEDPNSMHSSGNNNKNNDSRNQKEIVVKDDEPLSTFHEAQALLSKAYYRWGSASFETGDYASAVEKFNAALKCSNQQPADPLTLRRLQEAKCQYRDSKKRERVKFELAFAN